MQHDDILGQLVAMSNHLGDPGLDYAILGEGNTSALAGGDTFWVKASGYELRTIDRTGFVRVSFERARAILDGPDLTDDQVKQRLLAARVDPTMGSGPAPEDGVRPSVETVLHAVCLSLEGVNYVGHTHPTAVNALTCSTAFETAASDREAAARGRLFPDEIVVCGPASVVVPYTDPGLPLARRIRDLFDDYVDEYREMPKVVLMQNHGLIALGRTAEQVERITAMAVKAARIRLGTYAAGGPQHLSPSAVERIHTRPDEHYRRRLLGEGLHVGD